MRIGLINRALSFLPATQRTNLRHQFVTDAGVYLFGSAAQRVLGLLLLPVWLGCVSEAEYGIVGTMIALSPLLGLAYSFGVNGAIVREYHDFEGNPDRRRDYVFSVLLLQATVAAALTIALDLTGPFLWRRLSSNAIPFDPYVRLTVWTAFFMSLTLIPLAIYRTEQKPKSFITIEFGIFGLRLIGHLVFIYWLHMGALGWLISLFASAAIGATTASVTAFGRWRNPRVSATAIRSALAYGLPLVPYGIGNWILLMSDRVILEAYAPLSEVGHYSLGATLAVAMSFLVLAFNQAWIPYYLQMKREDAKAEVVRKIIRLVSIYVVLFGGICLIGVLFSPEIIWLLIPARFQPAAPYVAPILVGFLFQGLSFFAAQPLIFYKKQYWWAILTGTGALANIGMNLWLIPIYGGIAAAWTTLSSSALLFFLFLWAGRLYDPTPYPFLRLGTLLSVVLIPMLSIPATTDEITPGWCFVKALFLVIFAIASNALVLSWPTPSPKES